MCVRGARVRSPVRTRGARRERARVVSTRDATRGTQRAARNARRARRIIRRMLPLRDLVVGMALALPWLLLTALVVRRQRFARTLDAYSDSVRDATRDATAPDAAPAARSRVSIILPARNEATHIGACIHSLRTTRWPDTEIIVVNDHSTDDTRQLALAAADNDPRVRVIDAPDLPNGWFGKQWACHNGAAIATGSLLLFTDADTRHAPDLLPRLVHAREERAADLISVAGAQRTASFWEHAIQPAVFALLITRYGATTELERARRQVDVIANGQCLMMTRVAYDAIGGHAAVRATVAEDLMLAQTTFARGLRVSMVLGAHQLETHMYNGLREIVAGWSKNVYAGGRLAMWGGAFGRALFPLALVSGPLLMAAPFLVLLALLIRAPFALTSGVSLPTVPLAASTIASCAMLYFFARVNSFSAKLGWRVLLVPLGAVMFAGICILAIVRGQRVEWKGRAYQAE